MTSAVRRSLVVFVASTALSACNAGSTKPASPDANPGAAAQGVAVQLTPSQAAVAAGGVLPFAATVTGTANTSVTWTVDETSGGAVTSAGVYTAPASAGTFHVRATSAADTTKSAAAAVTVTAPAAVAVTISPATGTVNACRTLQLSATVTGSTNTSVTWTVQEGAAGGTITGSGLYTAPSGPGTYHVIATSVADPTKTAVATLTVNEVILAVLVSPANATVAPGATAQFTATVTNTCGTFTATSTLLSNGTIIPN
jgi:hypothetical protein